MRYAVLALVALPLPALAQAPGIGLVCDGAVALDGVVPSAAAPGEALVVVRNMVGWAVRFRQAAAFVSPAPEQPMPAPPLEAGRGGALPPGLPFEVPAELLDRALTERLFPGTAARTAPPAASSTVAAAPVARPPPLWRWLLPGEAVTLRVAPGPGGVMQRLGLQCDGGVTAPLAAPAAPR